MKLGIRPEKQKSSRNCRSKKGKNMMKYGLTRETAHRYAGLTAKVEWCMMVFSFCVAGSAVLFAAWAVVIGWSAVIERLAR